LKRIQKLILEELFRFLLEGLFNMRDNEAVYPYQRADSHNDMDTLVPRQDNADYINIP
jgi:hypothetical protein